MRSDVDAELALLERLSGPELRERWSRLTGSPVPRVSPALLRLALGYELQVRRFGGLSRGVQQTLDQIAGAKTRTAPALPGMRLVREWQGVAHVVVVGDDGVIRWDGRDWRSLSEVARAITGTRWSGPAFFGLKTRAAA
jgi:hypothetical protein